MPQGIQIINDAGNIQINQDSYTFVFHSKGTYTLNARVINYYSDISSNIRSYTGGTWWNTTGVGRPSNFGGENGLLAFRPKNGFPVGVGWNPSGGLDLLGYNYTNQTAPQVDWWYFTRPAPSSSGAGLEIYDSQGGVAYSSLGKVMKIVAVVNDSTTGVTAPYNGDWAICVGTPFPNVTAYEYQSGEFHYTENGPLWTQSGNTFAPNGYTLGARRSNDTSQFINGTNYTAKATQMIIDVAGL